MDDIKKKREAMDVFEDNTEETEEELRILNERLEHHNQNPGEAIRWENLKKQLLSQ